MYCQCVCFAPHVLPLTLKMSFLHLVLFLSPACPVIPVIWIIKDSSFVWIPTYPRLLAETVYLRAEVERVQKYSTQVKVPLHYWNFT